jgi:carotenoid cleavage dioxygenase
MVWHTLNAYAEGALIHVDVCRQGAPAFPPTDGRPIPEHALRQTLARWTIDGGETVSIQALSEVTCEYPRIDERRTGRPYRYGFFAAEGGPGTGDLLHRSIGRYDHQTGEMRLWRAPVGHAVSEPVFAAKSGASEEGRGYLLATAFDERRSASHLIILDAEKLEHGPMARAHLDHRVPAGFHGSFVEAS